MSDLNRLSKNELIKLVEGYRKDLYLLHDSLNNQIREVESDFGEYHPERLNDVYLARFITLRDVKEDIENMLHRNIPKLRKVMISQPMKNKTRDEIEEERNEMSKLLEEQYGDNYIVLDTTVEDHENKSDLECFSESIGFMSKCDVLVMGVGWSDARGCRLEHDIAKAYGVPILYLDRR